MLKQTLLAAVLLMMSVQVAVAQRPQATQAPAPQTQAPQTPGQQTPVPARYEVATPNEARVSQSSHVLRLGGREINYTATAGTLPIRLDNGQVAARMFFVAYTKDGEDPKTRPVSFLFNGGPGSASVWLHMGSFAPHKAQMAAEGFQPAPPYQLVDNESSLIDVSDMASCPA